ncbi:hypothetical protein [Niabella aquatica]
MKKLLSLLVIVVILASCDKADVTAAIKEPYKLDIEEMVSFMGKPYDSIQSKLIATNVIVVERGGDKKATLAVLDKESPNPNFVCEITERKGVISKIVISSTIGTHGTFKNTFHYFDNLLSAKYPLSRFYAIDPDGGVNTNNKTKEELYGYLVYNTSSGAALEFKTSTTKILNFCFKEADRAFALSIEEGLPENM